MDYTVKIGEIEISNNHPPLVIPEVGINHDGSFEKAIKLVDEAKKCGCKIIKFQSHITEMEMIKTDMKPGKISKTPLWEIIKKLNLAQKKKQAFFIVKKNIEFLSTPFSREAADRLNEMGVNSFKIGSGECNNLPLIDHISRFKKPIILSTGMNDLNSVNDTVKIIKSYKCPLIILHCTSMYPTPPNKVRLGAITEMINHFKNIPIGLSDHCIENFASFGAVALGAKVIEKHFTLSKKWPGPDNFMSLEPKELRDLVFGINDIWLASGGSKNILNEEKPVIDFCICISSDNKVS